MTTCRTCGAEGSHACQGLKFKLMTRQSDGVRLIADERKRQVDSEGWTTQHDDNQGAGTLAMAASCYARGSRTGWPWEMKWWKPGPTRIRALVKAGALIAAEIDRLLRAGEKP